MHFCAALYSEFQSMYGTVSPLLVLVIVSVESEVSCSFKSFGGKLYHNCTSMGFRTFLALQPLVPVTVKRHVAIKTLSELSQPQMMFSVGSDQVSGKSTFLI